MGDQIKEWNHNKSKHEDLDEVWKAWEKFVYMHGTT